VSPPFLDKQGKNIPGEPREIEITEHEVDLGTPRPSEQRHRCSRVSGLDRDVTQPSQALTDHRSQIVMVVDDQYANRATFAGCLHVEGRVVDQFGMRAASVREV
jgi:hypothetical protein